MKELPKKYNLKETEAKWQKHWVDNKIFKFDWNDTKRENIYSVDTPPPHVSGELHMGHIFGFSQMDCITRYFRMKGMNVYNPVGYDDNGLPSERYVEKKLEIKSKETDRQEFVKLCDKEIRDAEKLIGNLFKRAGYSFDWDEEYRTISDMSCRISQMSFIDLYNKGFLYQKKQPVIWDVIDQTALAQTEAEDKEIDGEMNYLRFKLADKDLEIMTTRPELLPACVAVMYHPDDKDKYKEKSAITPLGVEVPMIADDKVNKEKGTGVVMCCTFGDQTDVEWWKTYNLDLRIILNEKGLITFENIKDLEFSDNKYKKELNGLFIEKARKKILELLKDDGKLVKAPVKIKHSAKVGERSKYPLEILVKKQWLVKVLNVKEELHKKAKEINWYPKWMEVRIHDWIDGLAWDWCITRQRFFGVPVPVWYSKRKGEEGKVLLPEINQLPIDPISDLPKGYNKNEVIGEADIFDTWATSAVSPQLSIHAVTEEICHDKKRFEKLQLPFALRAQGHDIIRTWAFCTILKAYYHQNIIPWKNIMINGWCLSPDGTKMSKSKGNIINPITIMDEYGTDAIRYWTSTSNLGTDTSFSENVVKTGSKLITKLFNASKFVSFHLKNLKEKIETAKSDTDSGKICEQTDLWLISKLHNTIQKTTQAFEEYEYSKAREQIENFFWNDFCDNYLEIAKLRCYGIDGFKYKDLQLTEDERWKICQEQQSAIRALYYTLNAILKLFAPFIPHITEELFSSIYEKEFDKNRSVHARGMWPKIDDFPINEEAEIAGDTAVKILTEARKYKSDNNLSMKNELEKITVRCENDKILNGMLADLKDVCNVKEIEVITNSNFKVEIQ
jgi:valyl-tRNA synthetase